MRYVLIFGQENFWLPFKLLFNLVYVHMRCYTAIFPDRATFPISAVYTTPLLLYGKYTSLFGSDLSTQNTIIIAM